MPIHANQYADITNHEQLKDFKFEQRCPRYEEGSPKSSMLLIMLKAYHSFRTASRGKYIYAFISAPPPLPASTESSCPDDVPRFR